MKQDKKVSYKGRSKGSVIEEYYSQYKDIEINFNSVVAKSINFHGKESVIKTEEGIFQAVLVASSMRSARVLIPLSQKTEDYIDGSSPTIFVNLSFTPEPGGRKACFSIEAKLDSVIKYKKKNEKEEPLCIANLEFVARPPDLFIKIVGRFLAASCETHQRKEVRISFNVDTAAALKMELRETVVIIDQSSRSCSIRDLSLSGIKILLLGYGRFLKNKRVALQIRLYGERTLSVEGTVIRTEISSTRRDIFSAVIWIDKEKSSPEYRALVKGYLEQREASHI